MRAAILTVSTSVAAGEATDRSGPALAELARDLGAQEVHQEVAADDREALESRLRDLADSGFDLVLTTGGTGLAPSDVTPEATRAVIERDAPGIPEAMRAVSREHTDNWMLSRAAAGTRGTTLIVNFPGSPGSIRQTGEALAPGLRHALHLLAGGQPHGHGHGAAGA